MSARCRRSIPAWRTSPASTTTGSAARTTSPSTGRSARRSSQVHPETVLSVQANRKFLARSVRHLAANEGSASSSTSAPGCRRRTTPTRWRRPSAPESRVVYVDNDPIVLAHARALLTSSPEGATAYLDADIKDPGEILAGAARLLDFSQPVAIMLVAVLHMLRDEEDPRPSSTASWPRCRRQLPGDLAPGRRRAAGDDGRDGPPPEPVDDPAVHHAHPRPGHRLFDGLTLLDPGVVLTHQWRPDSAADAETPACSRPAPPARTDPTRATRVGRIRDSRRRDGRVANRCSLADDRAVRCAVAVGPC